MSKAQGGGVFDSPTNNSTKTESKEDFTSPENERQNNQPHKAIAEEEVPKELGAKDESQNVQKELDDLDKVTPEELKLAEQLIFKGYAELDVKMANLPDNTFTICSTSAAEMDIIEEMLFDKVKNSEDKDGKINIPNNNIQALRNALTVAISYRGMNKEELCKNTSNHLNIIKRAIIKLAELEAAGEIEEFGKVNKSLKSSLMARALEVAKLPTQMIDFLSSEKFAFDSKMHLIMTTKKALPKS